MASMNFGHDHVAGDRASIPATDALLFLLEPVSRRGRVEQLFPLIATRRDEVETTLVLITNGLAHEVGCSCALWMRVALRGR